jgi:hypothetical protein
VHKIVGLIHSCSDATSKIVILALAESPAERMMIHSHVYMAKCRDTVILHEVRKLVLNWAYTFIRVA